MSLAVVYIDDEPSLCRVFEMVLGSRNVPIATFTDAEAAIRYLEENGAAVVFCDYRMPKMTGIDVLSKLTRSMPFYMVSGDLDSGGCAEAPGVTGVLAKPFCAEELLEIVARHV